MNWYVMRKSEDAQSILIAYSYNDDLCDGLLRYDKVNETISIERMAKSADDFYTHWLFPHIHGLLKENGLIDKKFRVCIG